MAWRNSGMPAARRVFREPVGERLGGGVLDVLRRVEIRFARAKADDILAGGLHRLGLGINGQGERRRERRGAFGNFVIHDRAAYNLQSVVANRKNGNQCRAEQHFSGQLSIAKTVVSTI